MALRIPLKFLPFVLAAMLAGCGGGTEGPPVYPVKGTVTKGGQPVPGITVTFINQDQKTTAIGLTNETGAYVLISESGKPGMAAGKSKVTLTKSTASGSAATPGSDPGAYYQNMAKQREGGQRGAPPKAAEEELPFSKDYTSIEKTPLSFEIKTSANEIEIPIP